MSRIEEIKAKMQALVDKWKGKDVRPKSKEETLRTIDRMHYRYLKTLLDKELKGYNSTKNISNGGSNKNNIYPQFYSKYSSDDIIKNDIVKKAKEIFGID